MNQEQRNDWQVYVKEANTYDDVRFAGPAGRWSNRSQVESLFRVIKDIRGKRVLEIGAGTGRITERLINAGAIVTATDISHDMLQVARDRLSSNSRSSNAKFDILDIYQIDVELTSYSYIIMLNVFSRLSSPIEALEAVASRMSKHTRLVFNFNCLTSILLPFGMLVNSRGKSMSRDVTSWWYRPSAIERYCRRVGLVIVGWQGHHYVPKPNLFGWSLPLFAACDRVINPILPKRCPSVLVEARLSDHLVSRES